MQVADKFHVSGTLNIEYVNSTLLQATIKGMESLQAAMQSATEAVVCINDELRVATLILLQTRKGRRFLMKHSPKSLKPHTSKLINSYLQCLKTDET